MRSRWTVAALGVTAMGLAGAAKLLRDYDERHSPASSGRLMPTTKTIVVNRTPEDVYQVWLNFEQFPRFMKHLKQVSVRKDGRSHWIASGPGGQNYEWDAEIVENRPGELIAWRSLPGGDVENEGSVRFERVPGGRGTLVRVNLRYSPPGGAAGKAVAMLFGAEPGQEVQEDLQRFKQIVETGEVVLSDASVHARAHPAQPSEGTFRFPTPVPGAVPAQPEHGEGNVTHDAWPEPDGNPSQRAEVDTVPAVAARGESR